LDGLPELLEVIKRVDVITMMRKQDNFLEISLVKAAAKIKLWGQNML
jgi:predicted CoA-binding protein